MYCPEYIVVNNRFVIAIMHSDRDVPKKYVPKMQWVNPARYSLTFFPKSYNQNARSFTINQDGALHLKIANFVYRAKKRIRAALGEKGAP